MDQVGMRVFLQAGAKAVQVVPCAWLALLVSLEAMYPCAAAVVAAELVVPSMLPQARVFCTEAISS